jgi:hypothetical protein
MAPNRTPTNAKATRCKATEGAQQCLKAEHSKHANHTWGATGATKEWNADGTPKPDRDHTDQLPRVPEGGFVDVPESPMDAAAMQTPATPDPADHWTCAAKVRDATDGSIHFCDRHDRHDPDPAVQGHYWVAVSAPTVDLDAPVGGYFNGDNAPDPVMERDLQDMEAAREEQRADVADQRRAAIAAAVTDDDRKDMERIGASHPHIQRDDGSSDRSLVRPDAGESVLAALGGVYNPAAEPGYAIRLAEDFARLMVMGPHFASLVQANADKQPPDPKDVRALYRKLRQIAATHGIDLDDPDLLTNRGLGRTGGGS